MTQAVLSLEQDQGSGALARRLRARISKNVGRAICDYGMIQDGDKILVAASGGKDSLALCDILSWRRTFVPIRYELVAVHVDLGYECANRQALKDFLERNGVPLIVKKRDILQGRPRADISCFWCSWNRRKALFETAQELGCSKLALGHHKDDIVQTVLMNLLFEGQISAMCPTQELFKGKTTIIRPLAYVEEREIERYAQASAFPVPHCSCPNGRTSKRAFVKDLIEQAQRVTPSVKTNIFRSLQRVKKDYLL